MPSYAYEECVLEIWLAAGDETGGWDIVDGSFETDNVGLAWALAPASAWERALQMPVGQGTALTAFSKPIADRLEGVFLPASSPKYHVLDVWSYCRKNNLQQDIPIDQPQADPVLELLRSDAAWLLGQSGLGVLATGGNAGDAKAAGLGRSGDGLRERARAYAGLFTVALPFLPGDASITLLVEGRTELEISDAVKSSRFATRTEGNRYLEPFRDFLGRLTEDLSNLAEHSKSAVSGGSVTNQFFCKGGSGMEAFVQERLRGTPFLKGHAAEAVAAMKGIADLAAALVPRPAGKGCRLVVPSDYSNNLWSGNFRDLRHAIRN
jgi:hypothetical protein